MADQQKSRGNAGARRRPRRQRKGPSGPFGFQFGQGSSPVYRRPITLRMRGKLITIRHTPEAY